MTNAMVQEQINKARDEILRAPEGHRKNSNKVSPSSYTILPSRALDDLRFDRYPTTFRVFSMICGYATLPSGICFPNQLTIAERCGTSQQAVSRHFNLLIAWGYLRKVVQQNSLRKVGRKGATWRIIYDPIVTDEDLLCKTNKEEHIEQQEARKTIKLIEKKSYPQVTQGPEVVKAGKNTLKTPVDNSAYTRSRACVSTQGPELVNNYPLELYKKEEENIKKCINTYERVRRKYVNDDKVKISKGNKEAAKRIIKGMSFEIYEARVCEFMRDFSENKRTIPFNLTSFEAWMKQKNNALDGFEALKNAMKSMSLPASYKT